MQATWQKWLYSISVWIIYGGLGGMVLWEIGLLVIVKRLHLNIYKLADTSLVAISGGILFGSVGLIFGIVAILQGKPISRKAGGLLVTLIILIFLITYSRALSDRNVLLLLSSHTDILLLNIFYSLLAGIFIVIYSGRFGSLFGLCMGIALTTTNASIGKFLGDSSIVLRSRIRLVETLSIKKFSAEVVKTPNLKIRKQSTVREKLLIGLFLVLYGWIFGKYFGLITSNEGIVLGLFLGIYLIKIDGWIETQIFKYSQGKKQKINRRELKITRRRKNFIEAIIITIILVIPLIKILGIFAYLVFGTVLGLLMGGKIIQGEQQERISIMLASPFRKTIALNIVRPSLTERLEPNQGIRKSALNAIKYALVVGLLAGCITGYIEWHAGRSSLFGGLIVGLLTFGLMSWFIVGLLLGGKAVIQHFVLRSILWMSGSYPWNYAQFLEYANELIFMQKFGGRYQFIHDLLQEHFAQMEANQKQSVDRMR